VSDTKASAAEENLLNAIRASNARQDRAAKALVDRAEKAAALVREHEAAALRCDEVHAELIASVRNRAEHAEAALVRAQDLLIASEARRSELEAYVRAVKCYCCGAIKGTHGSPCIDLPNHDDRWAKQVHVIAKIPDAAPMASVSVADELTSEAEKLGMYGPEAQERSHACWGSTPHGSTGRDATSAGCPTRDEGPSESKSGVTAWRDTHVQQPGGSPSGQGRPRDETGSEPAPLAACICGRPGATDCGLHPITSAAYARTSEACACIRMGGIGCTDPDICRARRPNEARARLDEDGTAKPLTEIVAVMPEVATGEMGTVHVGQATHYVARPTEQHVSDAWDRARAFIRATDAGDIAREDRVTALVDLLGGPTSRSDEAKLSPDLIEAIASDDDARTDKAKTRADTYDAIWPIVDKHCMATMGDKEMVPLVSELVKLFTESRSETPRASKREIDLVHVLDAMIRWSSLGACPDCDMFRRAPSSIDWQHHKDCAHLAVINEARELTGREQEEGHSHEDAPAEMQRLADERARRCSPTGSTGE